MKLCRICSAMLALILLACLSGVQGEYSTPTSGYSTATPSATQNDAQYAQYSQYYTMNTGPAPNAHISVPQQYDITSMMPTTVYFNNQMQPVPFSMYNLIPHT